MSVVALGIGLALLILSMLFGTANLSLRDLSRHRLAEVLGARGKVEWSEQIIADTHFMVLTTSILRHLCHIVFTLCVAALMSGVFAEHSAAYYVSTIAVSAMLLLVFGIAIPNAWARHAGEKYIAATFPVLRACRTGLAPVVSFLHLFDGLVRRLAGVHPGDASDAETMEQEILEVVSEGERHGAVDEQEKEMIESVIEFGDLQVGQIMTPRTQVVAIQTGASLREARELINKEGHSRVPAYEGTIDSIQGVLYAKDLLKFDDLDDSTIADIMRPVTFIPETMSLRELLEKFQESTVHIAVILDEYGGTAGLVTMEDLLEELVGEITDEYEQPEPEPIVRLSAERVEVDARVRIHELNDELDLDLPEDDDYDTVGGFVFSTLGRIPKTGESFEHGNLRFEIIDAEERRINRLRITIRQEQQQQE